MSTEDSKESSPIVPNIVTEFPADEPGSQEQKARNRMVAEGYKYRALGDKEQKPELDAIDSLEAIRRKRRDRRFAYLLAFSAVAATCLVVVIIFQHVRRSGQNCAACDGAQQGSDASAYILNKMDASVDPCVNFYNFSCGNWLKTTELPPSRKKYGAFVELHDRILDIMKKIMEGEESPYKGHNSSAIHKARMYYNLCMDEASIENAGITPVLQHIKKLGSWPLTSDPTSGTFDSQSWKIQDVIVTAHKMGFSPLFNMGVSTDSKNSSEYAIGVEQSGLTLSDPRQYFTNHTSYEKLRNASITFGVDLATLLGASGDLQREMTQLYEFEQQLALIHVPKEELLDPRKTYHRMTVHDFQTQYLGSWLNLKKYMNDLFEKEFTDDDEIIVYTPAYFTQLQKILANTSNELLATYIVFLGVESSVGYLAKPFIDVALNLDRAESGITEYPPHWKRCLGKVDGIMGFATGALYIQEHFPEGSKDEIEFLFEKVRHAFIENLPTVPWMDEATRKYAVEKANGVVKMIGYPDYVVDPEKLDEHYENLTLVEGDFFASHVAASSYYVKKNLRYLGTVPDRTEWSMTPTTVNGYYSSDFNLIAFPAGILQPPMFNPTSPRAFNFGSFGMIMGHELTHGFDNKGKEFDKHGNMRNWWTNASSDGFTENSQCIVDQYSDFTIEDAHLDGKMTLSENIADNGGVKMAYMAYKNSLGEPTTEPNTLPGTSYTPDQLFFIGFAQLWCTKYTPEYAKQAILTDEHSISQFRVLGSMANSEYFAEAFSCPVGSPMNPAKKCSVW